MWQILKALALIASASLAGCTSLDELRASDPVRAGNFAGAWRAFAECVAFRLDDRVLFDAATETAYVGHETKGTPATGLADYEIAVHQVGPEALRVELRQRWTLAKSWAEGHYWAAVEHCGKAI